MITRISMMAGAVLAISIPFAANVAATAPPAPTSTNGNPVQLVATGLQTPTSFAFGDGATFEGDGGSTSGSSSAPPNGGVFVLKGGKGTELPDSPNYVAGLVWNKGTLYVSAATVAKSGPKFQLLAWSGWNGSTFTKRKAIYTAPKKFQGFNGLAIGPDGRLYVGVDVGLLNNNDHGPASRSPYLYDILSFKLNGKGLKVFATGIRQPWQIAFPAGSSDPLVSDLGQDSGATNPPDFLLKIKQGDNFGFPKCNRLSAGKCKGDAKPFKMFAAHSDVGGVVVVGKTVYLSEFGFTPVHPPLVVSMPVRGGAAKPFIKGFAAPIVGLGANGGYLYVGELSGQVVRVKL